MNPLEEKIESLCNRLATFSSRNTSYLDYIDTSIKEDNLVSNIAHTIAKALASASTFKKLMLEDFRKLIEDYNARHDTSLSADTFLGKHWIRIIDNYIQFPYSVSYSLRSLSDEKFVVPNEVASEIECLSEFFLLAKENERLLTQGELSQLLTAQEIELLVDRKILHQVKVDQFKWQGTEYTRHLRNEIVASLWLIMLASTEFSSDRERLRRMVYIILDFGLEWPDHLENLLDGKRIEKIVKEAFEILQSEADLIDQGEEVQKAWLDAPMYARKSLFEYVPSIKISSENSLELIQKRDELGNWFQGVFENEEARSFYDLLLRFIIQHDRSWGSVDKRYPRVLQILTDIKKPYLVCTTYWMIKRNFQKVLPVLLNSYALAPIVFLGINEIEIDTKALQIGRDNESDDHNQKRVDIHKLKTQFWIEAFRIFISKISFRNQSNKEGVEALYLILYNQAKLSFKGPTNFDHEIHFEEKKRFEFAMKELLEARPNTIFHGGIKPRIFPNLIKPLVSLLKKQERVSHYERIAFNSAEFELGMQLLKFCNTPLYKGEVASPVLTEILSQRKIIAQFLSKTGLDYFTATEIAVIDYRTGLISMKAPKWGSYPFGFDIFEWGLFYSTLHEYQLSIPFISSVLSSLSFEKVGKTEEYNDTNINTYEKIRLLIKSIGIAIFQIKTNLSNFGLTIRLSQVLEELYSHLESISLKHSITDLQNERINAFDERFRLGNDLHYQDLLFVVFRAVNFHLEESKAAFVTKFINEDKNLLRLLGMINLVDGTECKRILKEELQRSSIEDFIDGSSYATQWRSAMIEAINSHEFFDLALPLAERLESHLSRVQLKNESEASLLFEVKMLHAFKSKDFDKLEAIEVPKNQFISYSSKNPLDDKKRFFIGLFELYNNENFEESTRIFEELHSNNVSDPEYGYRLFHSRTMLAVRNSDFPSLQFALESWRGFYERLTQEDKKRLQSLEHNIRSTSIQYYLHFEEYLNLDTALRTLPQAYLFDTDIAQGIYDAYLKRGLDDLAVDYLHQARRYYNSNDLTVPTIFDLLYAAIDDIKLVSRLRISFSSIQTLPPDKIVQTIPENLNGKKTLDEFILLEIVRAGKILLEKVKALDKIESENKHNDLLQSILQFRFPVWGWGISAQARVGVSNVSGKDLGSSDFLITCAGENIALLEAMVLTGKDKTKTEEHIIKCNKYLSHTCRFYVITYFKGPFANFDSTWDSYVKVVEAITYPSDFGLREKAFADITSELKGTRNIKLGKTSHVNNINVHHIFFNISSVRESD